VGRACAACYRRAYTRTRALIKRMAVDDPARGGLAKAPPALPFTSRPCRSTRLPRCQHQVAPADASGERLSKKKRKERTGTLATRRGRWGPPAGCYALAHPRGPDRAPAEPAGGCGGRWPSRPRTGLGGRASCLILLREKGEHGALAAGLPPPIECADGSPRPAQPGGGTPPDWRGRRACCGTPTGG